MSPATSRTTWEPTLSDWAEVHVRARAVLFRSTDQKENDHGFAWLGEEYCSARRGTVNTHKGADGCLCHRCPWQHGSQAPHERSADLRDRHIRAQGLHV